MNEEIILRAQPIGEPPSQRYVIQNLTDNSVWDGCAFVEEWDDGRKYATASDACADMAGILREVYGALPRRRFVCPVEIEVYGAASRTKIARYLHRASVLNIKTHEYGNGPAECLVIPTIHFGLLQEIEDVPMLSHLKDNESEVWSRGDNSEIEEDGK